MDESWIGTTGYSGGIVRLVPRLRAWIAARFPGTRMAITEYSWGGDVGTSSTLAQAEALAIVAREGVDLATRWVAPADGSRIEDAFSLYLNYDGAGGRVQGQSVRASSTNVDQVRAYAIVSPSNILYLLLFNKDTVARTVSASVAGGVNEATLGVGPLGPGTSASAASFHTLTPCRAFRHAEPRRGVRRSGPCCTGRAHLHPRRPVRDPGLGHGAIAQCGRHRRHGGGQRGPLPRWDLSPVQLDPELRGGHNSRHHEIVGLGTNASIRVRANQASGSVHVILDVNGYFE